MKSKKIDFKFIENIILTRIQARIYDTSIVLLKPF